jgi:hypothetical protein
LAITHRNNYLVCFSHCEIKHGLTNEGIPLVNSDQLNAHHFFSDYQPIPEGQPINSFMGNPKLSPCVSWTAVDSGDVINCCSHASKITHSKLQQQVDWDD